MARTGKRSNTQSQLRIISGQWRGRKLRFSPADGLRPTGDRVRETLFNWLAPAIAGARCADLFAGSGALGLEALSRGAAHCDFVDSTSETIAQLRGNLALLDAESSARCHIDTAEQFLSGKLAPYDIVFIDPPFQLSLVAPVCKQLAERGLLSPEALVYVETAANDGMPDMPAAWNLHRDKTTGGVAYRLYQATRLS